MITSYTDSLSVQQRDDVTEKVTNFFYRTRTPFNLANSAVFKDMIQALRPANAMVAPSGRTLGGSQILNKYNELFDQLEDSLLVAPFYSLVSDGWSNLRNEHMVNSVVIIPKRKPFFLKSVSTVGINLTGQAIAHESDVILTLGMDKCVSVVTGNAANMQVAWGIIEDKYPHIFANGRGSHVMNLMINDICFGVLVPVWTS